MAAVASAVRVAVVVLNWNGGNRNLVCLEHLKMAHVDGMVVWFVDNGSVDGSADLVEEAFPNMRIIRNEENLGFCGGSNVGMKAALAEGADWVLLLNNDVYVDEGFLSPLLEAGRLDAEVGAIGPKVLLATEPDKIWAAGGSVAWRQNVTRLLGHMRLDDGTYEGTFEVDYVPGCTVLLRADALRQVGMLDPTYFLYMEDVDLGVRLNLAGWKNLYVGSGRVYHEMSKSTGGGYSTVRKYANAVNSVHFLRRYGGTRAWAGFLFFDVLGLGWAWLREVLLGRNPRGARMKARGLVDGLRGRHVTRETVEALLG